MTSMASELFVLGTSQRVAAASVRERMHVDLEEVYAGLAEIMRVAGLLDEAVPLATCGRLEVYCLSPNPLRAARTMKKFLSARCGMGLDELDAHSYTYWGEDAARHLFRVASGLDSVVYGEAQILGQVREAMLHPGTERTAGSFMKRLFQSALAAGKRVRAETEIGRGSASVAGAALCLLEAEAGSFADKTALVVGAGETGALVARLLRKAGVARVAVANRTRSSAEALAAELGGEAYALEALPEVARRFDILVGAVTGRDDLITAEMLRASADATPARRFILDLAHPRNFSLEVRALPGVRLMDLAEIFHRVEEARKARAAQVPRAEAIIDAEVENFVGWIRSRLSAPVLRAVREQVLAVAQEEAERRARGRPAEEQEEIARFARALARTLLHAPTVAIRGADPATPEGQWLLRAAPALFGVEAGADHEAGGVT